MEPQAGAIVSGLEVYHDPQCDYEKFESLVSKTIDFRIIPAASQQTLTVDSGGGQYSDFIVPVGYYNYGDSELSYTVTFGAPGATFYNWAYVANNPHWRMAQFLPQQGSNDLVNLNYADYYSQLQDYRVKFDKFLGKTTNNYDMPVPSRVLKASNYQPGASTGSQVDYLEKRYMNTLSSGSSTAQTANTATPILTIRQKLRDLFPDTVLGFNKVVPQTVQSTIRLTASPIGEWGLISTSLSDPTASVAAISVAATVSNIVLNLKRETNQELIEAMNKKMMEKGELKILVPWVKVSNQSGSGTSQSPFLDLLPSDGIVLDKIIYAPFGATNSGSTLWDHSNTSQSKVVNLQDNIDSLPINPQLVVCSNYDDLTYLRSFLEGSILYEDVFAHNWVWIRSFGGFVNRSDSPTTPPQENIIKGIKLDTYHKYSLTLTTANATLNHFIFAQTKKYLVIRPGEMLLTAR